MAKHKAGVSRKQSRSNFPKNEHFLPPDTHTSVCISGLITEDFVKITSYCWNIFYENIAKLVIDNAVLWEVTI